MVLYVPLQRLDGQAETKEYEEQFMQTTEADMNMKVGAFVETYFRDKQGELKERSIKNKR